VNEHIYVSNCTVNGIHSKFCGVLCTGCAQSDNGMCRNGSGTSLFESSVTDDVGGVSSSSLSSR
jgi:hypothetical protein